ncbi:MAG: hypothetical protein KIS92_05640 [Planctomycetota bacterium]|nr:hypothetical protein [Planctomycetota bacterium]
MRRWKPFLLASLWLACCACVLHAEDAFDYEAEGSLSENVRLVWETERWGKALVGFSGGILAAIVFCTANAGNAYRCGSRAAFAKLPPRTNPEGLVEIRDRPESGPMHRALKVGLVAGRGGLLISKSAVLAAWETERGRYRHWPRVLIALGLVSLALGLLSASQLMPRAMQAWLVGDRVGQYTALDHAHALLNWGLTNCFVALLLFFIFDRITQMLVDRSTLALVRYLGDASDSDAGGFPQSPAEALKANGS